MYNKVIVLCIYIYSFPGGSVVKNPPAVQESQEMRVRSLGWEDPLEEGMEAHSSILDWRIPWTEEFHRLQSTEVQKSWTWLKWLSIYTYTFFFKYSFPLWLIIGYWIQFSVLCSRTLLFMQSLYKNLDFLVVSSVQLLSCVRLFATPWIAACQASLSITNSRSPLKLMSIKSVMPSNHLILWHPLLLLPPILPSIRVFSNESTVHMRWPKYWSSASASVLPINTQDWSPLEWTDWISLQSKGLSRILSNTTVQKHQFFGAQLPSQSNSHIHTWPQEKP